MESDQAADLPLLGPLSGFDGLKAQYCSSPGFLNGVACVEKDFSAFRSVRGDGNCFYRAFLFSYVEVLSRELSRGSAVAAAELDRVVALIKESRKDLIEVGYDELAFETFLEMFLELMESLPKLTPEQWERIFVNDSSADYYTWFMRLLASCNLKRNRDRFEPFLEGGGNIEDFCKREVEPMGVECDHVQITALTEYLGIRVEIVYLDNRLRELEDGTFSAPSSIIFPESDADIARTMAFPKLTLLYRPGHYDIIYPRSP